MVGVEVFWLSLDVTGLIVGIKCVGLAEMFIKGSPNRDSSGAELGVIEVALLGLNEFSKEVVSEGGIDEVISGVPPTTAGGEMMDGDVVGDRFGDAVGKTGDLLDGTADGSIGNISEGAIVGKLSFEKLGVFDKACVGDAVGTTDDSLDGFADGSIEGVPEGAIDGAKLGVPD